MHSREIAGDRRDAAGVDVLDSERLRHRGDGAESQEKNDSEPFATTAKSWRLGRWLDGPHLASRIESSVPEPSTRSGAPENSADPGGSARRDRRADSGDQATSNRSRFMTLSQAATKSCTNFCCASDCCRRPRRNRPQLRVGTEDQVDPGARPLDLARLVRSRPSKSSSSSDGLSHSVPMSSRLTKKSLVRVPGRSVKTPWSAAAGVGVQGTQAADEHRHLRSGQRQQVRRGRPAALRPSAPRARGRRRSCGSRPP